MTDIRTLPVLPLRDIVVFPHMVVPLFVGRDKSVRALEEVMRGDKHAMLFVSLVSWGSLMGFVLLRASRDATSTDRYGCGRCRR